jgi:hypothetical protein
MAIDLTRIGKLHVGLLATTGSAAYATGWVEPRSLLLGGAVMGMNFWLLKLITDVLRPNERPSHVRTVLAVGAMTLKFAVFLGLLAALFWRLPIEGMSFACGVTLLLVACLIEAARSQLLTAKGV